MSWKKRNQKLRGPKVSKKVRTLCIYPNPGGKGFYADPRHKQRIFEEDGVWYHQSIENNYGVRFKLHDPKDRWSLPTPAIWAGTVVLVAMSHRATITRLSQLRSKRKAKIARQNLLKSGYKAAVDAMAGDGKPSSVWLVDSSIVGFPPLTDEQKVKMIEGMKKIMEDHTLPIDGLGQDSVFGQKSLEASKPLLDKGILRRST